MLLQGVTGSGKTEVYKALARHRIARDESVIVLVPEISLTSQIIDEFIHEFPDVIVTHSKMTEAERHRAWLEALTSTTPRLVIGPRSALFMPLKRIGAIIIDEAHEPSYKQEQAPRYSALRAAGVLGRLADAVVVIGSATPSVSDRYVAEQGGHAILRLDSPARALTTVPVIRSIDMTKRENFSRHRFLSTALLESVEESLRLGQQSLLFHNRRGARPQPSVSSAAGPPSVPAAMCRSHCTPIISNSAVTFVATTTKFPPIVRNVAAPTLFTRALALN